MRKKIGIAILNWNGEELLSKFLPSVLEYSKEADVYVIDNGSTDGSISLLTTKFAEVKIIKNNANLGFTKGYNKGIEQVPNEIVCLLNSDIEVTKNWLVEIEKVFTDSKVAICQPKILDYKDKSKFEYAGAGGGFIDNLGYPYCRGRVFLEIEQDQGQYDDICEVFWASGAAFFIRREIFIQFKGLDELFFAHQEEIDLCWRVKNNGFRVMYCGLSTVYHVGGATLDSTHPKKTFLNFRNTLLMNVKNIPFPQVFLVVFIRMVLDFFAMLLFIFRGSGKHAWAVFIAHLSFYKFVFFAWKKRGSKLDDDKYYIHKYIAFQHFVKDRNRFKDLN